MKNFSISICVLTFTVFFATSCSKSYNCHCVYKTDGAVTQEDDHKINEGKKEKSAEKCKEMNSHTVTTLNGVTFVNTIECELN